MNRELSAVRLYSLKFVYLFTGLGVGVAAWSRLINPGKPWDPLHGVAFSFWAAYATLMLLGVRLPARMLPLMLLQLFYKVIWLAGVAIPLWSAGRLSAGATRGIRMCAVAVLVDLVIIPWPYVFENYIKAMLIRDRKPELPSP